MIHYNTDGTINAVYADSEAPTILQAANVPTKTVSSMMDDMAASFFNFPKLNINEIGTDVYQGVGSMYSKVQANLSRLATSAKQTVSNISTTISTSALNVSEFFKSTFLKVFVIVGVAAVIGLFLYAYIQAKAGRIANA